MDPDNYRHRGPLTIEELDKSRKAAYRWRLWEKLSVVLSIVLYIIALFWVGG